MIERYTLPEMGHVWSEQHKYELWCRVETLVLEWGELFERQQAGIDAFLTVQGRVRHLFRTALASLASPSAGLAPRAPVSDPRLLA